MTKPQHTKLFNLEHAKAGAPFCVHDGQDASILKWDVRYPRFPLLGIYGSQDSAMGWNADGISSYGARFNLVMTPLGFIDGKPVFTGDEIELKCLAGIDGTSQWKRVKAEATWAGTWNDDGEFSRWPAPAPVYPETLMTDVDFNIIVNEAPPGMMPELRAVANAALRHAIEAGQVVEPGPAQPGLRPYNPYTGHRRDWRDIDSDPMGQLIHHPDEPLHAVPPTKEAYDQCSRDLGVCERLLEAMGHRRKDGEWITSTGVHIGWVGIVNGVHIHGTKDAIDTVQKTLNARDARDMAIAEAVRDDCYVKVMNSSAGYEGTVVRQLDLAAIIAGVKA